MIKIGFVDGNAVKVIEELTKTRDGVEQIKKAFYIDAVSAVMHQRYDFMGIFDAFAQNCFYIADLLEVGLITDDDEGALNTLNIELFHKENNKKRGD